jgi:hypothetical protein
MSWVSRRRRAWRVPVLALLLVAVLGPWAIDRIVVPAEFACSSAFVRLEGDYRGAPLSGTWTLWAMVTEFTYVLAGLVTGAAVLTDLGRGPGFIAHGLLLVLPNLSTLLLIVVGDRRRQVFDVAVRGLAAGTGLLMGLASYP